MGWRTLLHANIKETLNYRVRFNRTGLWMILFESIVLILLILGSNEIFKNINRATIPHGVFGLYLIMTQMIMLGNSYIMSERILFGFKGKVNIFLNVVPKDALLSTILFMYLSNLRPIIQSPTITAIVFSYLCFPEYLVLLLSLFLITPLFIAALAVITVVINKRFFSCISGIGMIVATAFTLIGLTGTAWLVSEITKEAIMLKSSWINSGFFIPTVMWLIYSIFFSLTLLIILIKKSNLWVEGFEIQEEQVSRRLEKNHADGILSFLRLFHLSAPVKAVILKDWLHIWRNPLTKFRLMTWLIIMMILLVKFPQVLINYVSPLMLVYIIWYFCFGELITTTYQGETNRLGLLWLAAVSPGQLAIGKILALFPLILFTAGTAGIISFVLGLGKKLLILMALYSVIGVVTGIVLSLAFGSLSMNRSANNQGNSITEMAFEQVPITFASIGSMIILGIVLAFFALIINFDESISVMFFSKYIKIAGILNVLGLLINGNLLKKFYLL